VISLWYSRPLNRCIVPTCTGASVSRGLSVPTEEATMPALPRRFSISATIRRFGYGDRDGAAAPCLDLFDDAVEFGVPGGVSAKLRPLGVAVDPLTSVAGDEHVVGTLTDLWPAVRQCAALRP
jgi:hypothetical protein